MARIRTIKPDFFDDEHLSCLPFEARLLFQGLWCLADKAGRLEDRPKYIKAKIFPYDNVDINHLLELLSSPTSTDKSGKVFIRRYTANGQNYIDIPGFEKHQRPHNTEADSVIPEFNGEITVNTPLSNGYKTLGREGKGKEGNRKGNEEALAASASKKRKPTQPATDEEFLSALKSNPAYKHIDIDNELAKMDAWLMTPKGRGRQKTRAFVVNWLNKVDKPMAVSNAPPEPRRVSEIEKKVKLLEAYGRGGALSLIPSSCIRPMRMKTIASVENCKLCFNYRRIVGMGSIAREMCCRDFGEHGLIVGLPCPSVCREEGWFKLLDTSEQKK